MFTARRHPISLTCHGVGRAQIGLSAVVSHDNESYMGHGGIVQKFGTNDFPKWTTTKHFPDERTKDQMGGVKRTAPKSALSKCEDCRRNSRIALLVIKRHIFLDDCSNNARNS